MGWASFMSTALLEFLFCEVFVQMHCPFCFWIIYWVHVIYFSVCVCVYVCVCVCIYRPICALPFHLHNNVFNAQMFFILMLSSTLTLEQHRFDCASSFTHGLSSVENTIVLHHLWTVEPEDVEPQTWRNHIFEDVPLWSYTGISHSREGWHH